MPAPPAAVAYTSLTQRVQLCLEPTSISSPPAPGEQLLMPLTAGAGTMSLTTQPNTLSPTTGMHLHFFVIGNTGAGTIGIVGTNATGGAQTSITYHVPAAPQSAQGYNEFTTKEAWGTVTAASITLTTLTPCQIIVYGSFAGKILIPATVESEEKIPKHSPPDKRGVLWKNLRVSQLAKGVSIDKFDADLYPDSLYLPYNLIGAVPVVTTQPAAPVSLLAATTKAATMTLTTGLATVPPGMFLIFTLAANSVAGTIVLSGFDNYGGAASETITVPATNGPVYSTKRYSSITSPGANQFTTTGLSAAGTIAVTAVFAWTYTWTYDGINNIYPYTNSLEIYNGVFGYMLPGTIISDGTFDWQKEKEILFTGKGEAQDFCIVGDPTATLGGSNPFATLAQPSQIPLVSWPATWYIDAGSGTPFTTQDGSMETFKLAIMTGRKWKFSGDGMQRASYVTWETQPDFTADATILLPNYQNYVNYFKPNLPMIFGAQFQGNLLGSNGSTVYYENIQWTLPVKIESFKADHSKNPTEGVLKLMAEYSTSYLGYAYKCAWTCQVPPTYTS